MPVSWGGNSATTRSYDIEQFIRFFDARQLDCEMRRTSGLWEVTVWERLDNPSVYDFVVASGRHESLGEALIACYTAVRRLDGPVKSFPPSLSD